MLPGKRGRKPAQPDYVEKQADGRVRCKLCMTYVTRLQYRGTWVQQASLKSHEKLEIHLMSVSLSAAATQMNQPQDGTVPGTMRVPLQRFVAMQQPPLQLLSAPPVPQKPTVMDVDEQHMWDKWDGQTIQDPTQEEKLHDDEKELDKRLDEYGITTHIWDEIEDTPDSPDHGINSTSAQRDDNEQEALINEILERIAMEDEESAENPAMSEETHSQNPADGWWFPYPSKTAFLLDTIDNLPRLRISDTFMKVILWLLRELGVKNVPSFYMICQIQKKIADEKVLPTIHWKSTKGNTFFFNDPRAIVANEWSNPLTAGHIHRYPVIPKNGVISEVWHGQKWRTDLDRHLMSPMYDAGNGRHFFIDEPAKLLNGQIVIPTRWLEDEQGLVWLDAWEVVINEEDNALSTILDDKTVVLNSNTLKSNMLDLEKARTMPQWCPQTIERGHAARMPNPDRARAEGFPIYTSFIDVFADDVSGNRSKSWNKHINIYITLRNLPRKLLQQQSNVHFVSASTYASSPEQFQAMKEVTEETLTKPIRAKMATSGLEIRVKIVCNCGPGDNPAQSEICGHIGGGGNLPCRKCKVGGTQAEKETDDGFHAFFAPGIARSSSDTLTEVDTQIKAACLGVAVRVQELQTKSGVKDGFTQAVIDDLLQRAREMHKDKPKRPMEEIQAELLNWVSSNKAAIYNPFLTLKGFDTAKDTPVEILHTILLGVARYGWHFSHSSWNDSQKKMYVVRLQATVTKGLSLQNHSIRANYIMQYANSLIGRQLKTLVQVNVFHIYDLVDSLQFSFNKAVGELSALLWFPEIRTLEEYLIDVETAAANVLDIAALIDPSKVILKIKYHLLTHLREDIIRFGPLVGVATETFECFNAIFRFCSILSNHMAPSRDIALQLARQEVLRHLLAGGSWLTNDGRTWQTASLSITKFFLKSTFVQALVGNGSTIDSAETITGGTITLEALKRGGANKTTKMPRTDTKLVDTLVLSSINSREFLGNLADTASPVKWHRGKAVTASMAADNCSIGSWVFASSTALSSQTQTLVPPICGRIQDILQQSDGHGGLVLLDVFEVCAERHNLFGTPVLECRSAEPSFVLVAPSAILFEVNVQHDCQHAKCTASGTRNVFQERAETDLVEAVITHCSSEHHLINSFAFHNAHLLRSILPRDLTRPIPYSSNRKADHARNASNFRSTRESKQAATAAKKKKVNPSATESAKPVDSPPVPRSTTNDKDTGDCDGTAASSRRIAPRPLKRTHREAQLSDSYD